MERIRRSFRPALFCLAGLLCALGLGCCSCQPRDKHPLDAPKELAKYSIPAYVIEPPDILLIDAVRIVPLPPYKIEPLDALLIQVKGALPTEPISGVYGVEPEGTAGMSIEEAQKAILAHLKTILEKPEVLVSVAQSRAMQQIRGEHLVRPDGTVGLGIYGSVCVAGMTIDEARGAIEAYLSQFLQNPEISLDVYAYNSKVYYVIFDGGGYGEQIVRLPFYGNETVLDALGSVNGLPPVSSSHCIWVARPRPHCQDEILAVNWDAITKCGSPETNYQLYPGDRVFVKADTLITTDNWLAKAISPIERLFNITLLGNLTVRSFRVNNGNNGNGGFGF
jgi:polysaccharide export outer membrane protein